MPVNPPARPGDEICVQTRASRPRAYSRPDLQSALALRYDLTDFDGSKAEIWRAFEHRDHHWDDRGGRTRIRRLP